MFFPITTLCVVACLVAAYRYEGRRSPLLLAFCAWGISLLLGSPIIFKYAVEYSFAADAFAALCLSATTGTYLYFRHVPRSAPADNGSNALEIRLAQLLGVTGILGCLLLLADAYVNKGLEFSIGYLLDNLSSIRTDNFDALESSVNPGGQLGVLGSLLAPCTVLCVIAAVRLGREVGRSVLVLSIIGFVLVAAVSLMVYAGRATIVNLALLALISLFVSGRQLSPFRARTLVAGAMLLVSVWYLATSFLGTRVEDANAIEILDGTQRAETRQWIKNSADRDEALGLAVVSVGYFASPMPTLTFYMQQRPRPGPFYGAYSYPLAARVVGTATGTWNPERWVETRQEIYAPIEARNYFGNVWSTWLRDLLVDFGYIGAILFCGLFGAFMAWARNRFESTGGLHYHYMEVIACFTIGFGAFTSFLWSPFLALPFFLAVAIMVVVRMGLLARIVH